MPAASKPYSMAVAPSVFFRKFLIVVNFSISFECSILFLKNLFYDDRFIDTNEGMTMRFTSNLKRILYASFITTTAFLYSGGVMAQNSPQDIPPPAPPIATANAPFSSGMKNIQITSPNAIGSKTQSALAASSPHQAHGNDDAQTTPSSLFGTPSLKPLDETSALIPVDQLKDFDQLNLFMALRNDDQIEKAKKIVTLTPDAVPPIAYYYLAHAIANTNDMEAAAFYYYVAELRNTFDALRFPAYRLEPKNKNQPTTKTTDQIGAVPQTSPRFVDPRGAFNDMTASLGRPIRAWIVKHPDKFRTVLARVKLWDAATAYRYRPPYDLSSAVDFKTWPDMLKTARVSFFETQNSIAAQLDGASSSPDNATAPRPFGR